MRKYPQADEERIRAQTMVREWTRSKLLDPSQRARLEGDLRVDVRRTNVFLRAGLAVFTGLIVAASVLLVITGFDLKKDVPIAATTGLAALVCIGLAEALVGQFGFYRFGVEETLAVAAVILAGISAGVVLSVPLKVSMVVGLLVGAAGGFGIYRRFGFVYAALGSMVCAAAIPFQLDLSGATTHLLAAAAVAAILVVVRAKRMLYQDDYPGDEYGQLQAAAWAGLYVLLNLQLTFTPDPTVATTAWMKDWFYWCTYVTMWVLPIVGLRWAIREKDRSLLGVSSVMALVTLLTNKLYLGWPRHTWDPILLGVLLMAVAVVLRRWLSMGPGGERGGFTAARLLRKESDVLSLLSAASGALQPNALSPQPDSGTSGFDGGRSGGGGAGGTF